MSDNVDDTPCVLPEFPDTPLISLSPPRPLSDGVFPLEQEHFDGMHKSSAKLTELPTNVDELAEKQGVEVVEIGVQQLEIVTETYDLIQQRSTVFRDGLSRLFTDLIKDIVGFSKNMQTSYPKIYSGISKKDKQTLENITRSLSSRLTALIIKAGHAVDVLSEADDTVEKGKERISEVHENAGDLAVSGSMAASVEKKVDKMTAMIPRTITTLLTVQGGFSRLQVNLELMKKKTAEGNSDPVTLFVENTVEAVTDAWKVLQKKAEVSLQGYEQRFE